MIYSSNKILMMFVLKIVLPDYTIRLCDGGMVDFQGEEYNSRDPIFGIVAGIDKGQEGSNDSAPGLVLTLAPEPGPAAKLSSPGMQSSSVQVYALEVDQDTNNVINHKLEFDGRLDFTKLMGALKERSLDIGVISEADWLFARDEGNTLSDRFHQEFYPGELGLTNITGVERQVAWGVGADDRGTTSSSTPAQQAIRHLFS